MTDVWNLSAIEGWEKIHGKHPTQKPINLLARVIAASTRPGAWILDPFAGSSTTGVTANLLKRRFLGIDIEQKYLELSILRRKDLDFPKVRADFLSRIYSINVHAISLEDK